ncbi:MAG: non-canonical purine NTP pyrophosphatase [Pyrinomonadaceae bacterium]
MTSRDYELLIGTSNPGKVREIRIALNGLPLMLRSLNEYSDLAAPIEGGESYRDNAIIKATDYARQTGLCALADDSGLEVDWLDGAPGLHSARFGSGSDADRVELLLKQLEGVLNGGRRARFVSVVAIVHPTLGVINVAEGECRGRITDAPLGKNGFGYDPIFIPEGYEQTFGQLTNEVKSGISHRAKSLALTKAFLAELLTTA